MLIIAPCPPPVKLLSKNNLLLAFKALQHPLKCKIVYSLPYIEESR